MDAAALIISAPAVLGVVNLLKGLGVQGKWSALLSVLVAFALVFFRAYAPTDIVANASTALILGLGACGLYDTTKTSITESAPPSVNLVGKALDTGAERAL